MAQDTAVLQAVERLGYRVTVGDVAATAGLPLNVAQQGVLALASDVRAHLQVSETGEIAYQFPRNARAILLSQSWRLRLQEAWNRVWRVLFYLVRISFGILLILSIVLIAVTIIALTVAAQSSQQGNSRDNRRGYGGGGGGFIFMPRIWFGNPFYLFDYRYGRQRRPREKSELNFLEAIFSFLFGDGNPNEDLEDRRWQTIAAVIRNNRGAVVAEQIAPYLDTLGEGWSRENEDYVLPVLSRFNGQPEVSPEGQLVYHFPELQVTAENRRTVSVPTFLQELPRRFSQATSGQITMAVGLGSVNLIGAVFLRSLLSDPTLVAQIGELGIFVSSIYWLLLGYGAAFLGLPLVRYFWVQRQNRRIDARNSQREERAIALSAADPVLQEKLAFARQFAAQAVVSQENLAYTTEQDLIEQEAANPDRVDEEWRKRLRQSNP
jgi:hypothetical protein